MNTTHVFDCQDIQSLTDCL